MKTECLAMKKHYFQSSSFRHTRISKLVLILIKATIAASLLLITFSLVVPPFIFITFEPISMISSGRWRVFPRIRRGYGSS